MERPCSAETPQSETLQAAGVKYSFILHEDILYSKQSSIFFIQNASDFYKTNMKSCKHLPNLNHLILSLTVSQIYLKSNCLSKKSCRKTLALNCRKFSDSGGLETSACLSSRGTPLLLPNCLQVLLQV